MSRLRGVLIGSALGLLAAGCASFPEQPAPAGWSAAQQLTPQAGPVPELPGELPKGPAQGQQPGQQPTSVPPPQGCKDFNPAVVGTCLSPVSGVALTDVNQTTGAVTALATERTGRLVKVTKDVDPVEVAKFEVDAAGDGGLTGLALSPTYAEDQLVYVYVTTATDNRVMRLAPGDVPKPVLTGIPKGPTGNRGALAHDRTGALLVATGDAGNPSAAADPGSLAGKVLRIDGTGQPARGNPTAGSRVLATGLKSPGGLCVSGDGTRAWVTDAGATADLLYRVDPGKPLGDPAWSWPERPGVGGCASFSNTVSVATAGTPGMLNLSMNPDGSFTGKPEATLTGADGFGRLGPVLMLDDATALVGTVNKTAGGAPVSSDDRVVIVVRDTVANGSKD